MPVTSATGVAGGANSLAANAFPSSARYFSRPTNRATSAGNCRPVRVAGREFSQVVDEPVLVSQPQFGVEALLDRPQPRLVQPTAELIADIVGGDVGQGRSSPQGQRLAQDPGCFPIVGGQARSLDRTAEAVDVDLLRIAVEHVPLATSGQVGVGPPVALIGQRAPQAADMALHDAPGGGRWPVRPEHADQAADRYQLIGLQQQHGQYEPLLSITEFNGVASGERLYRTQQPELHSAPRWPYPDAPSATAHDIP
jgi:hypothetical protein